MVGKTFTLTDCGWRDDRQVAYFCYEIETDERTFALEETLTFPVSVPDVAEANRLLRSLHIALATSYYKAFVPPVLRHPYAMTDLEASFWNTVYRQGLGEFLHTNDLDPSVLAQFREQEPEQPENEQTNTTDWQETALLGIGGGKDSIVAGELLKDIDIQPTGFVLATGEILGQTQAVADVMGVELIAVNRVIDRQILDINQLDGAYNGHIPISLIFGLVGAMLAVTQNSRYVVVANEASASIPQASTADGMAVNHQWSKSLEFERLFQDYLHAYVSEDLHYFSAIRPLTSVAIAKLFSNYPQYFEVFTSDNSLFKINQAEREHPRWSLDSPKSLSSYILFTPWLDSETLQRIFGRNFLDQAELEQLFLDMLGVDGASVLDCVGTPEELRISLGLAHENGHFNDSALMQVASQRNLLGDPSWLNTLLALDEHALPTTLAERLTKHMEQTA